MTARQEQDLIRRRNYAFCTSWAASLIMWTFLWTHNRYISQIDIGFYKYLQIKIWNHTIVFSSSAQSENRCCYLIEKKIRLKWVIDWFQRQGTFKLNNKVIYYGLKFYGKT